MIASVHGHISAKGKDYLVIEVHGIGYQVHTTTIIVAQAHAGEELALYTTLIVREDSLTLYGFPTPAERDLFETVITVSGVGPKMGLSILSTLSVDNLRNAIVSERDDLLTRVPGVGKKTAQKIVLDLKDKLTSRDTAPMMEFADDTNAEVLDALTALGFSVVEAQRAIQMIPPDAPPIVEERLKLALQQLG
ncbi:MAG: Holliday junction branch migration protein RuvA [Phototrophicaceae bacterium]|jgi:Holliday junction DNA helicase RuvA